MNLPAPSSNGGRREAGAQCPAAAVWRAHADTDRPFQANLMEAAVGGTHRITHDTPYFARHSKNNHLFGAVTDALRLSRQA